MDRTATLRPAPPERASRSEGERTGAERTAFAAFEHITPNWFASVMGTGIVANAAATLPVHVPGLRAFATVVWLVAALLLGVVSVAFALHWTVHRARARAHAADPVMVQFYGAVPMALLTVAAGSNLVGDAIVGRSAATVVFVGLWAVGSALAVATSVVIPYRMITVHAQDSTAALPAWLMPVVPPMVSASTGSLLVPHVAAGQARELVFALCYVLFGLSLIVGMLTVGMIYARLLHGGAPAVAAAPTVWITLGVIGQSITAANLLGNDAALVFVGPSASVATGLHIFGIVYGLLMGGFGFFMAALALALTVHAARHGLGFSLTWWSFTFPVGTCVTGAGALGGALGLDALNGLAVALYAVLVTAWIIVAANTVHGVFRGELLVAR